MAFSPEFALEGHSLFLVILLGGSEIIHMRNLAMLKGKNKLFSGGGAQQNKTGYYTGALTFQ